MKAFIISYNRLTPLKKMCDFLYTNGCEPIIIDNASTYPPLLEWLSNCPYEVHLRTTNGGHQVLWNELPHLITERYYIVTDHDLDISAIPTDFVKHLMNGLRLFPQVMKAGLSLSLDGLPENEYTKEVINWERKFWETELRNGFYLSDIDTTFALYDSQRNFGKLPNDKFFKAVRSDKPYTAIHLPWYNTLENMSEEETYYLANTGTYWAGKFKELI